MKNRFVLSFITVLTLSGVCAWSDVNAQQFEGKLAMKSGKEKVTYLLKGDMIRVETPTGGEDGVVMLYNRKESKTFALMEQQKMYYEIPAINVGAVASNETNHSDKITKTGETKDILGYKCEKWVYKEGNDMTEMWITDKLGINFSRMFSPVVQMTNNVFHQYDNFFPMKITFISKGKPETFLEVVSVEKTKLPDHLFSIPDGYKKMTH